MTMLGIRQTARAQLQLQPAQSTTFMAMGFQYGGRVLTWRHLLLQQDSQLHPQTRLPLFTNNNIFNALFHSASKDERSYQRGKDRNRGRNTHCSDSPWYLGFHLVQALSAQEFYRTPRGRNCSSG